MFNPGVIKFWAPHDIGGPGPLKSRRNGDPLVNMGAPKVVVMSEAIEPPHNTVYLFLAWQRKVGIGRKVKVKFMEDPGCVL